MADRLLSRMDRRQMLKSIGGTVVGTAFVSFSGTTAAQPTPADWPTFQYDTGRSGYHPDAKGPKQNVSELWRTGAITSSSSPPVVDGLVYHGGRVGRMYAYDADDGSIVWSAETEGRINPSRPTVVDGTIYEGDAEGYLYAFDAQTGDEQWRYEAGTDASTGTLVANNTVYVMASDVLHAVDSTDGTRQWTIESEYYGTSPVMGEELLYFGSERTLWAIDPETAEVIWQREGRRRVSHIVAVDDGLYVTRGREVIVRDAADGSERWRFRAPGNISNSPAVSDRLVYFGDTQDQFYAITRRTGEERWRFSVGEARFSGIPSSPAVVGNVVYFGSYDQHVYALQAASGRELWSYDTGAELTGSPTVVGRRLYIGGRLSDLIALG